jgi:hypothetical protein
VKHFVAHVLTALGIQPASNEPVDRKRMSIVVFSRSLNRIIVNEPELVRDLQRQLGAEVRVLRLEDTSFAEQASSSKPS